MACVSIIISNFNNHQRLNEEESQRQRNNVTIASSPIDPCESLREDIIQYAVNRMKGGDKRRSMGMDANAVQEDISNTLEQVLSATLANIVSKKITTHGSFKSSSIYDSAVKIMDLVSNLSCSKGDGTLATSVIEFMKKFADVELESVRAIVCDFMSSSIQYLHKTSSKSSKSERSARKSQFPFLLGCNSEEEEFEWREEVIALIKEIIIERLQDKSQAVRYAAIEACGNFYHLEGQEEDLLGLCSPELHEDVTEALMWNLAHDPSFANRAMALKSVPIVPDTIPLIIERVRDSKLKVRVDALQVLATKVDFKKMSKEQRANILRDGLSTRYPATYTAATKMLCCGWMKSTKFDPIALLELLDPTEHEDICQSAARAIITAASGDFENDDAISTSEGTLAELSNPEIRAYKEEVLKSLSIADDSKELTAASIIYMRTMCDMILNSKTLSEYKKSTRLAEIIPDVTVLGQKIEKHVRSLNETLLEMDTLDEDDENDDEIMAGYNHREDTEVFICLHLLKLCNAVELNEEGSRRHFSSIVHRILCDPGTHVDLVEGLVQALSASHDNEAAFLLSVSEILTNIVDTSAENGEHTAAMSSESTMEQYLRAIEILSVALEKTSRKMSSNAILQNFRALILDAITNSSLGPLVREAGVSCLGRYVILMDEDTIIDTFKPLLLGIAFSEEEKIEIRAQALLALCDLAFLCHRILSPISLDSAPEEQVTLCDLLLQMLSQRKKSLAIVAAECAAKLMFTGKVHDANIAAHLVAMYFDKDLAINADHEQQSVQEVGSPTRLEQFLTIFFPAYSMGSAIGRDTLIACTKPLLMIVHQRMSKKVKGQRSKVWPIAKMVEYICHTIENGEDAAKGDDDNEAVRDGVEVASPILNAAISISEFLNAEGDDLSTAYLRSLCKILNKSYIDPESEDERSLRQLKRNLDDLAMNITDTAAMASLENLIEILEDVQSDEDESIIAADESMEIDKSEDSESHGSKSEVDGLSVEEESQGGNEISDGEKVNNENVPIFATLGHRDDGKELIKESTPMKPSRTSKNEIPAFALLEGQNSPKEKNPSEKESRRSKRKASGIPLFASIGAGEGHSDDFVSDSESDSDASSSSCSDSDEYSEYT